MSKNTVKLTESRLRSLVEACVKEALEDALEEGYGWDVTKDFVSNINGDEGMPSWEETKEFINGKPDHAKFRRSKDSYEAAKDGMIYTNNGERSSDPLYYAHNALESEPGIKGKIRRAGVYGAGLATYGAKKAGKAMKKGFNKIKDSFSSKEKNSGDYDSFTM